MTTETVASYKVKTGAFEGPMDVLLSLIEERKLFINEIALATIADDYIAYVRNLSQFHAGDVTGFILIAATLVLIKSKSLLPNLALTDEESGEIIDLERRLRLYQLIKDAGIPLKEQFGKAIIFARSETFDMGPVFSPDTAITKEALLATASTIIASIPKKEFLPEVTVKKVISIEEMIASLADRIQQGLQMSFSDFAGRSKGNAPTKEEKVYVIVSFLAMLELVREGLVNAIQGAKFEDITLERQEIITEIINE
jgi:segregation and condensation protein A